MWVRLVTTVLFSENNGFQILAVHSKGKQRLPLRLTPLGDA